MTIEELLVFGKKHSHSEHAKILLAELLNKNSLELLNYLDEKVDDLFYNAMVILETIQELDQYSVDRVNLTIGSWNPRGYSLAADYYYNGGDLSISENDGKMYVSIDG